MNNASGGNIIFHFKGDTKGLSSSMGGLTKSFALGTLAAKGISKALQVISSNIGDAVKRVDTLNNFPKVMKAFGVSTKEAQASIKRIDKSIRGLPTSLDTAVSGVRDFFMVTKNLKQAEAMFKAVNDSALIFANGSQEAVQRFTYAYKQSLAAGKVDAQNFRQMNEAIPGVMDKVAQSMGMSMQQLKSGLSDGSISMDQFNAELIKLDTQGGAGMKSFGETAKTSTAGIQTSITNMKTAFVRGLGDIINKVNESLKPFGGLSGVISKVGQVGESVFKAIGNVLAFAIPKIVKIVQWLGKYKDIILLLVSPILAIISAIKIYNTVMAIATAVQAAYNAVMMANPVVLIILAIIAAITLLVGGFILLWNKCEAFRNFWIGLWNGIMKILQPIIDGIVSAFNNYLKPAIDNLIKAFQNIWNALQPIINFIINIVIVYIQMVIQWIQFLWSILQPIIMFIINILGVLIQVVIAVISGIINVVGGIINFIAGIINAIIGFIKNVIKFISSFGKKLVSFITEDIPNFINGIVNWFAKLPGRIWQFISQLPGKIGQAIGKMVNTAKQKIPQVINAILNKLKSLPGKVLSIGLDVVKGIGKGITNGVKWIKNVIKGFVGNVMKFLKKLFHIGSPSKLMADEIGQWIPKGIAVGIEANTDSISKTMGEVSDMITSSFGLDPSVASSMSNNFSPTVNTNVTVNQTQDPLGRMVNDVKTFSGGSRQDYNYGLGG